MTDKKWSVGTLNGYAVITHDDFGHIPAWNETTANGLARILNEGLKEVEALSTEAEGDAYFHGWFDGYSSMEQDGQYSDDERPLTDRDHAAIDAAWEKHKQAKPNT